MVTSEQLQAVAGRLAQEPFNKSYSMVSMDAMAPDDFITLLNEIIHHIDPKPGIRKFCELRRL